MREELYLIKTVMLKIAPLECQKSLHVFMIKTKNSFFHKQNCEQVLDRFLNQQYNPNNVQIKNLKSDVVKNNELLRKHRPEDKKKIKRI